jgi:hypothetical protein
LQIEKLTEPSCPMDLLKFPTRTVSMHLDPWPIVPNNTFLCLIQNIYQMQYDQRNQMSKNPELSTTLSTESTTVLRSVTLHIVLLIGLERLGIKNVVVMPCTCFIGQAILIMSGLL